MGKKSKTPENPTVIFIMSTAGILLGFSGVNYLLNIQGIYDILMGIALVISGFIGGIMGFIQYWLIKKETSNKNPN
ncbi:hypothetical protein [Aquibacillus rhizosphaerae]|uniref:AtpZ/AtpI family protein n=1 Tax=Aquibacillus rhizosphaerae TaxID=3051431 RepID=A0ABT7L4P0_9BACI|nr:hypothetical protein [Aquibacillus sp. LR5S19]MDL4840819.1 hypothetical protein [Aquibacillus sp. LR5S19]